MRTRIAAGLLEFGGPEGRQRLLLYVRRLGQQSKQKRGCGSGRREGSPKPNVKAEVRSNERRIVAMKVFESKGD